MENIDKFVNKLINIFEYPAKVVAVPYIKGSS